MKFGQYLAVLTVIWTAAMFIEVYTGHPLDHYGQLGVTALAAAEGISLFTTCRLARSLLRAKKEADR